MLQEFNKSALRDIKFDLDTMTTEQLNLELQKSSRDREKRELLLTEIGHLRINLFQEYYERIQLFQQNKELNKAVKFMNEYIEKIALPFVQERLNQSLINRITHWLSADSTPDAGKVLQEWNTKYETWFREQQSNQKDEQKRTEQFNDLKKIFFTLYTISFSFENFPPVATEPSH